MVESRVRGYIRPAVEENCRKHQHDLLNSLVSMVEAATLAYIATTPDARKPTDTHREAMAHEIAQLVTLYALSPDREQIQTLTASDLRGARFVEGGATISFDDGRADIPGVCMTRTALNIALETVKRARA
jgi:hypothetical protein